MRVAILPSGIEMVKPSAKCLGERGVDLRQCFQRRLWDSTTGVHEE